MITQQKKNRTRNQHYIPQVYLRGFSPEYSRLEKCEKKRYTIYFYDFEKNRMTGNSVPIKSVCYEKNLYEVTGDDGNIICQNFLEKCLSKLENMFGKYRSDLEKKAFNEENYKIKCFLKREEKAFWITYMTLQILRLPETLEIVENVAKQMFGNEIPEHKLKSAVRSICLPFFKELTLGAPLAQIFDFFVNQLGSMNIAVGVDRAGRIITSDNPVFICSKETSPLNFEKAIFPVSSEICLFLLMDNDKEKYYKNVCFEINESFREEIIKNMSARAFSKLFSNHILDCTEMRYLKESMPMRQMSGGE